MRQTAQSKYDSKLNSIQKSGLWRKASTEQRDSLEDNLYDPKKYGKISIRACLKNDALKSGVYGEYLL